MACGGGRKANCSQNTHDWCQGQHQPNHNSSEVDGRDGIQDDEDTLVVHGLDAVPEPDGEDAGEDVQVEEEAEPGGRLVLRHGRDDGDVVFGVALF